MSHLELTGTDGSVKRSGCVEQRVPEGFDPL